MSLGPYRYGSAKSNILAYFFILFLHIFDINYSLYFQHNYFFIYRHIFDIIISPSYFPHIPSYLLDQGIPECDVIRREWGEGCTCKSWYYLAGHKTWKMSKFLPLGLGKLALRQDSKVMKHNFYSLAWLIIVQKSHGLASLRYLPVKFHYF